MRRLSFSALVAALMAACASESSSSGTTTTGGEESELNSMDVKCRAEVELGSSFDLTPVEKGGKTILEGTLVSEDGVVTTYTCRPVTRGVGDAGASESIATCIAGDSTVELVRDNEKRVVNARIEKNASNATTELPCAALFISAVVPSYTSVAPYIHRACAGCHEDKFDSLEKVKAQQDIMLGLISSRAMPRRDPVWLDSAEGKAVLAFLAKSNELK